jgi:BASS family bile acid:Na+ symporter
MMVFPVARLIALLFLIPFGAGVVMRRLAPRAMARASEPIVLVADLLLLIAALFLLPDAVRALPRLGAAYPIAIAGITAFSLLVGDVAAGSQAPDRRAVSLICAARHPGLALLVAQSNFPDGGVLPAVMVSLVVATLVTMPYALWRQRGLVPATVEVLPSAADVSVTVDTPLLAPPPSR